MKSHIVTKFLGSLAFFACASLSAAPMTISIDVAGTPSVGLTDDPDNTVRLLNVGANSTITSVSYNVSLTAFAPSWLQEIGLVIETSARGNGPSRFLQPGLLDERPGSESYADTIDLVAEGLSFAVGADGILRLEFAEFFNDEAIVPDGIWNSGTIIFGYDTVVAEVPEPTTSLLMGAGLAMLGYAGRRRRAAGKLAA